MERREGGGQVEGVPGAAVMGVGGGLMNETRHLLSLEDWMMDR